MVIAVLGVFIMSVREKIGQIIRDDMDHEVQQMTSTCGKFTYCLGPDQEGDWYPLTQDKMRIKNAWKRLRACLEDKANMCVECGIWYHAIVRSNMNGLIKERTLVLLESYFGERWRAN